jgi:hypothetical protein
VRIIVFGDKEMKGEGVIVFGDNEMKGEDNNIWRRRREGRRVMK